MLTVARIICALQHLQLCNSHQGVVWLWIYIYFFLKCQPSQDTKYKMYCSRILGGFVSLKNRDVGSSKRYRYSWNIFLLMRTVSAMLFKLGKRKLLHFSQTCLFNFTRRKVSLKRNPLRSFYRKYLSFHPRQRNSTEINDDIIWYKQIMVLSHKPR